MHWRQPNWTRILTILLVILATYAILYVTGSILLRFGHAFLLFILGAMSAYILTPFVNRLERYLRVRWVAIFFSYIAIALFLFLLGVLLVTPFVQQAQSLVDNLHTPSASSLRSIAQVRDDSDRLRHQLSCQVKVELSVFCLTASHDLATYGASISQLQHEVSDLRNGTVSGLSHTQQPRHLSPGRVSPNPVPQTRVPPSYVNSIAAELTFLQSHYATALSSSGKMRQLYTSRALADAQGATRAADTMYHVMSTTPILLIRSQGWLDQHGIHINLHDKFGQAATNFSDQGTYILDNTITILSETFNILLNTILILIIAFYLLLDGRRLIHQGMRLIPIDYRDNVWFFLTSVDKVVGGYIRGQLFLSALAGVLGGAGAAMLGVPYPLLIGIVTFLLESVPVIGPMVAVIPAVVISLFFVPLVTTVILLVWFMLFQQIVTNILGPRIMGMAVGIHPLEALLAVMVGYPLAGFLGAFLAVPVAGIIHILIREGYSYFVLGRSVPTVTPPPEVAQEHSAPPSSPVPVRTGRDSAAS